MRLDNVRSSAHRTRLRPFTAPLVLLLSLGTATGASVLEGQSLLERTPNITGDWVGVPGTLHFNFLHRFTSGEAPARKVVSSPTFLLAVGLPRRTLIGFNYATNSDVAPRYPNEWEPFVRWAAFEQEDGALLDAGVQAGYNVAARSADGEASIGQRVGPVRVRAAARFLSNAYDLDESRTVFAGGAVLRLGRHVALSGDYASMLDRPPGYDDAWGGAVQLAIPYSPHTFSLHVTNANTATLQGLSAARGRQRRYGFEFTVPVTLRRYFGSRAPLVAVADSSDASGLPTAVMRVRADSVRAMMRDSAVARVDSAVARRDSATIRRDSTAARPDSIASRPDSALVRRDSTTVARATPAVTAPPARRTPAPARATTATGRIRQFTFSPGRITITAGTTITWTNTDPVAHTVTADDGSWTSEVIEPGKVWRRRFDRPGTYSFHCMPHPFMKGVVVVRSAP